MVMATSISKPSSKPASKSPTTKSSSNSSCSSSLSSHLAMVELKSRILASISKLTDRDTYQIAVDELEKIIQSISPDAVTVFLNALTYEQPAPPAAVVRRESLRLLAVLAVSHPDAVAVHIPKIISHIIRRLKDPSSDSSVRDACRDAVSELAALYIRPEPGGGNVGGSPVVALFVKPLLEAMGEQSKVVQAGAAGCLAKVVESVGAVAPGAAGSAFQKLCPRISKLLLGHSFLAKGALLSVVSSLSQVGAISPQNMQPLLQSVRECLSNTDWATRKAAAESLTILASYSSDLIGDEATSTVNTLEACRFDKVKPVRDSIGEALSMWKKITGKDDLGTSIELKDAKYSASAETEVRSDRNVPDVNNKKSDFKDSSDGFSPSGNESNTKGRGSLPEKAVVLLKKKAPSLTDKELNLEFFQKLETRKAEDLLVEVVLPRRNVKSSNLQGEEETEFIDSDSISNRDGTRRSLSSEKGHHDERPGTFNKLHDSDEFASDRLTAYRGLRSRDSRARGFAADDKIGVTQTDHPVSHTNIAKNDGHAEGPIVSNKGNWLTIQRQLSQLERQQLHLMNMLQDFMGGSHDSMITLENRVRGLERVVEEMARDLALPSGRRDGAMMPGFEGSPGRASTKYNGYLEYSSSKFGRMPLSDRFLPSDSVVSGTSGRDSSWRSDSENWDSNPHTASRAGHLSSRRGLNITSVNNRLPRIEQDSYHPGSRRAWDKRQGQFRLGEGPSARSVWQASKDEATLEAIRVAGEDNVTSRIATLGPVRELDAEGMGDENVGQEKSSLWDSWTRAMDSLHIGDVDSAYAEVVSAGDDILLVKLMEKTGPVIDQLSNETANNVLHALAQCLLEQSLYDIALSWLHQLIELSMENGSDFLGIPIEGKREILINLNEASALEIPEDLEGPLPEQIMVQLASVWGIDLQHLAE